MFRPQLSSEGVINTVKEQLYTRCLNINYYYRRGRVSKYVTNGSKTAVIDVIYFLCVSLGSVQIYDGQGSRRSCACSEAAFSRQNGDRA
jgi:hypothetical protein